MNRFFVAAALLIVGCGEETTVYEMTGIAQLANGWCWMAKESRSGAASSSSAQFSGYNGFVGSGSLWRFPCSSIPGVLCKKNASSIANGAF